MKSPKSKPPSRHQMLRYSSHADLVKRAGPIITNAASKGRPVVVVVPDNEGKFWIEKLNDMDILSSGRSVRILVYPVNLQGWAWGLRTAYVAGQRALEERLEVGGQDVLVIIRLPDVLLLIGERQGMEEVEKVLAGIATIGTVVCAYHKTLTLPGTVESQHGVAG